MTIFEEYAQIKLEIAKLEQKRKELEILVLDELDGLKGVYMTPQWTLKSYGRKVYEYSSVVSRLSKELAAQKKAEELTGQATIKKITNVLVFTPVKGGEENE